MDFIQENNDGVNTSFTSKSNFHYRHLSHPQLNTSYNTFFRPNFLWGGIICGPKFICCVFA
eukprot:UN10060